MIDFAKIKSQSFHTLSIAKVFMLKFRLISLLAVVTAVCIGAFLPRPSKHPPEVRRILTKVPSILGSSHTETLAVLFGEKFPKLSDYYRDRGGNRCCIIEIATGYQLVYFVKENEVVEHLSVESWDEKEISGPLSPRA